MQIVLRLAYACVCITPTQSFSALSFQSFNLHLRVVLLIFIINYVARTCYICFNTTFTIVYNVFHYIFIFKKKNTTQYNRLSSECCNYRQSVNSKMLSPSLHSYRLPSLIDKMNFKAASYVWIEVINGIHVSDILLNRCSNFQIRRSFNYV